MVIDFDDFGCNHVISDKCQSHDCRDKLDALHYANPDFKVTLFAIPCEMTLELAEWCHSNKSWVELAVHGFYHATNYECEKMSYDLFDNNMEIIQKVWPDIFVKGFKAPGWQISDDAYKWFLDNDWWVADQDYNTGRRPKELKAYINRDGQFFAERADGQDWTPVDAWHGHTWDVGWNGIYEVYDEIEKIVKNADEFKFVSELF